MVRSKISLSGFNARNRPVASSRLLTAVAASLVLALFLCAGLTLMTITTSVAMPLAH